MASIVAFKRNYFHPKKGRQRAQGETAQGKDVGSEKITEFSLWAQTKHLLKELTDGTLLLVSFLH